VAKVLVLIPLLILVLVLVAKVLVLIPLLILVLVLVAKVLVVVLVVVCVQMNVPCLNPSLHAGTRSTYPGGMEG